MDDQPIRCDAATSPVPGSFLDVGVSTALVTSYAEVGISTNKTMYQDSAVHSRSLPPETPRRSIGTSPDRSAYADVSIHQTPKPEPKFPFYQHSGTSPLRTTPENSPERLSDPGDLPSRFLVDDLTFLNAGYTTGTNRFRTSNSRRSSNALTLGITSEAQ